MAALDSDDVIDAYARWARVYDWAFGRISAPARHAAVGAVNAFNGTRVLEVGVGTGLALPLYRTDLRITGIDLSRPMLDLARKRVAADRLDHVEALLEMDAEATSLPAASFDAAVAMFVASVVPAPRRLLAELRRVVRVGGRIVFVNHFAAERRGARLTVERGMAPLSRMLGWHPDFAIDALLDPQDRARAVVRPMSPGGLFTLVELEN